MTTNETKVGVVARHGVDLHNLAKHDGPLASPCGTAGTSIARAVLEGNGQAEISMSILKIAIDTQDGVQGILDNFDLYDLKTKKPLIWSLVTAHLKS